MGRVTALLLLLKVLLLKVLLLLWLGVLAELSLSLGPSLAVISAAMRVRYLGISRSGFGSAGCCSRVGRGPVRQRLVMASSIVVNVLG